MPRVRHLPRLLQAGHHVSSYAQSKDGTAVYQRGNQKGQNVYEESHQRNANPNKAIISTY